ncbi:hypothetical protein [Chitinophaga defluvii]|uniref:Uncharacterized protein n=1 Tax=Chitinophaga defluvii TaxID=3163343 RepID=A0ABV2T669_9BACT
MNHGFWGKIPGSASGSTPVPARKVRSGGIDRVSTLQTGGIPCHFT